MKTKDAKRIFRALADETRFRILSLLLQGELCVCDIMCVLKEPQSKISRHLSYLRRAGLVSARKDKLWMHYRLSEQCQKICKSLIGCVCGGETVEELSKDSKALRSKKSSLVSCCK